MNQPPLRIAQVSPLYESVPPKLYGGTERIVSYLTESLVDAGHEVTLFASGDSKTRAKLIPCSREALRLAPGGDQLALHLAMLEEVYARLDEFDVVHFHVDYLHYPVSSRLNFVQLTTLHGRLDIAELQPLYRAFSKMPVVSISDAQREPLPQANWKGTVYHGLPSNLYKPVEKAGKYLAFLGRISPEKGVDKAIEIAVKFGMPLKIAAKVDRADQEYYDQKIVPLLKKHKDIVEFIGEIGESQKGAFLGGAYALVFPIHWREPFGIVMIEAMACGTPVVAFRCGSVPEVMHSKETGFVVSTIPGAVSALERVAQLSRTACRAVFDSEYSAERMAADYVHIYKNLLIWKAVPTRSELTYATVV